MITIDKEAIAELLEESQDDVLSLYLRVDPSEPDNRRSPRTEAWRLWMKNALRDLEQELPGEREARIRWAAVAGRLETVLQGYQPHGKTLALFVGPEEHRQLELPILLEPRAGYGAPLVKPMLWAVEEYKHYLVVLVSADAVRVVSCYLGYVNDVARVELDENWGMREATRSGHAFKLEARREEYQRSYQRAVAERVSRLVFDDPDAGRVILGGNEREAHGVRNHMHPQVAQAVIAVLPIPVDSTDEQIAERIENVAFDYERDREREIIDHVIGMARSQGRAVVGEDDVLRALDERLVRTLILASPMDDTALGERLLRRSFGASSTVEFVHGRAADLLRAEGGVAADLYYVPAR